MSCSGGVRNYGSLKNPGFLMQVSDENDFQGHLFYYGHHIFARSDTLDAGIFPRGQLRGGAQPSEVNIPKDIPTCRENLFTWLSASVDLS